MKDQKTNFKNNKNDFLASSSKGILGVFPIAGPALAEIINLYIPNQRLDRIGKYLEELRKIIPEKQFEIYKSLPEKVRIIEEGLYTAALLTDPDKLTRICLAVANGLSREGYNKDDINHKLQLIKLLSTTNIIILTAHTKNTNDAHYYTEKHNTIFPCFPESPIFGNEELSNEQYQVEHDKVEIVKDKLKSHEQYLASLGLLRVESEDWQNNTIQYKITVLGKELLETINSNNVRTQDG